MSVQFAASGTSSLVGVASDITGLSYPFTVVSWAKYTNADGFSSEISSINDTGDSNAKIAAKIFSPTVRMHLGTQYGFGEVDHATAYADNTALIAAGWQLIYFQANSATSTDVYFNGVEESFPAHTNKDIFANQLGDLIPRVGYTNYGRTDVAHYAVFNRALSAGEKTNLLTKTPDNLGGALPLYYKTLESDISTGIGSTLTDADTDVTINAGDNPTLTAPTPVNPAFTAGPTATAIGETTVTASGTSDEAATAQVVVVASGAGQPSDGTFDASGFSVSATATNPFTVPVTGLTGLTAYDVWVRLKPNLGTSTYAFDAFTTTPAAPVITTVSSAIEGATVTVDGSGFTGHTAADINGTSQTNFNLVSDIQVTFTAVKPVNTKFGVSVNLNIGGTVEAISLAPKAGFSYIDITDPLADKVDRIDSQEAWDLADGYQLEYFTSSGEIVIDTDGTLEIDEAFTIPGTIAVSVFDGSAWFAETSASIVDTPSTTLDEISVASTTATFNITSSKNGSSFWRLYLAALNPTDAQIIFGTGATDLGSFTATSEVPDAINLTGLVDTTNYIIYGYSSDGAINSSIQQIAFTAVDSVNQAPVITSSPASASITVNGSDITLVASATGTPVPTVQWQKDTQGNGTFVNIAGATSTNYIVDAATVTVGSNDADQYRAVFTNSEGSAISAIAVITVLAETTAPVVTSPPINASVVEGTGSASFTVAYTGTAPISIQWQKDSQGNDSWANVVGETSAVILVAGASVTVSSNDGDKYRVVLTNVDGSATSTPATLTVTSAATSPIVTLDPVNESVVEGIGSITFNASATGNPNPTVQWQKDTQGNGTFANISGATSASLVVTGVSVTVSANNADQYRAVFTNIAGVITSSASTLTVTSAAVAPVITVQPTPKAVNEGSGSVTFTVSYTGTAPITVQWQKDTKGNGSFSDVATPTVNGVDVTEASNDGDQYRAILTNSEGSVISDPAELTVTFVPVVVERIVIDEPGFYIGTVRRPDDNEEEVFSGYQNESELMFLESSDAFDITVMTRFQIIINSVVVLDSDVDSESFAWGVTLPASKVTSTNLLLAKLGDTNLDSGTYYADIVAWRGTDKYVFTKERRLIMKVRTLT